MIKKEIDEFNIKNLKERFAVKKIKNFIENDKNIFGKILVLYGLQRTGKTTMMEQVVKFYNKTKKCAFYEITTNDDMDSIKQCLFSEKLKGTEIICFDEITRAEDFIENSSMLPDIFAKENMKILVTGDDSLGFVLAEKTELFDRTERIRTTYISYVEYNQVLNKTDIDDYILHGGVMYSGECNYQIKDYETAKKYLDGAVAENIYRSINQDSCENPLKKFALNEIKIIIEKLVEFYCENIKTKDIQEEFKNTSVTDEIIKIIKQYLAEIDLLSSVKHKEFHYTESLEWEETPEKREIYFVQPAIKFFHLQKLNVISNAEKSFTSLNTDEKIKSLMLQEIILFDTTKDLPASRYYVCKISFFQEDKKVGNYDMLVYDKIDNKHWLFEIKNSIDNIENQENHLTNKVFNDVMEEKFGKCASKIILYKGISRLSNSNILYINISDFLLLTKKHKDITQVLNDVCKFD